jgi:uncharacterized protein (DUF697 family)
MLKIAAHIVTRLSEFFPLALIGIGLVATASWVGAFTFAVFGGAWSILLSI